MSGQTENTWPERLRLDPHHEDEIVGFMQAGAGERAGEYVRADVFRAFVVERDQAEDRVLELERKIGDAAEAITALRAQLADARRFKDRAIAEACAALETMRHRNADLPPTLEQALALPEIAALVEAAGDLLFMLDALKVESGRGIEYGYEDAFRMGEWFEDEDLSRIEHARAAIRALKGGAA
jgi:hypothetical protein